MRTRSIFIYGYFGCDNAGDELLLQVVLDHLQKFPSVGKIRIKCLNPPPSSPDNVEWVPAEQILSDRSLSKIGRIFRFANTMWAALKGIDLFLFGGGTLFHAAKGSCANLLILLLVVFIARLRGAKVLALGVGVARIQGLLPKSLFALLLMLMHDFAVRDNGSQENIGKLDFLGKARRSADLVFLLPTKKIARPLKENRLWGITLAASAVTLHNGAAPAWVPQFVEALNALSQRGFLFRFLSFQELEMKDFQLSDDAMLNILKKAGFHGEILSCRVAGTAGACTDCFQDLHGVIGMRFHSLVLAAKLGLPFVGFGQDQKLADLCKELDQPFLLPDQFAAQELIHALETTHATSPPAEILQKIVCQSATNFGKLDALLL